MILRELNKFLDLVKQMFFYGKVKSSYRNMQI